MSEFEKTIEFDYHIESLSIEILMTKLVNYLSKISYSL